MSARMDYVYVIATIENGVPVPPCKIGITRNVKSRLSSIQTGNPKKLELIAAAAIPSRDLIECIEKAIHGCFEEHRLVGEWFNICPVDASIGVCVLVREAFVHVGLEGEGLSNALENLGITEQISCCYQFLDHCKANGLPIRSKIVGEHPLVGTVPAGNA